MLNGGDLAPLNVFHNPIWVNQQQNDSLSKLQKLDYLNKQLDEELSKVNIQQKITIGKRKSKLGDQLTNLSNNKNSNPENNYISTSYGYQQMAPRIDLQQVQPINYGRRNIYDNRFKETNSNYVISKPNYHYLNNNQNEPIFPKINALENRFKQTTLDFTKEQRNSPLCIRREGMLKIRDVDQKDKDVVVTYAVLTKDRLSYFVNAKDESSIQGSIALAKIKESLKLINGFPTCFTIKTVDGVSDCSICAESDDSSREWINAITQNAVNCNTMSALNNLNKRGLMK